MADWRLIIFRLSSLFLINYWCVWCGVHITYTETAGPLTDLTRSYGQSAHINHTNEHRAARYSIVFYQWRCICCANDDGRLVLNFDIAV